MITWRQVEDRDIDVRYIGPMWTIELTDGRQTRRLGAQHLDAVLSRLAQPVLYQERIRFTDMMLTQVGGKEYIKTHNVYWVLEPDHVTWEDKCDAPVLGTVRSVVRWPREDVRSALRAAQVAKRLRALSEPHQGVR